MLREFSDALVLDLERISWKISYLKRVRYNIQEITRMKNDSTIPRDSLYEQLDLADGYGTTYLVNRSPFEAIEAQFGLSKDEVIDFMRRNLKVKSFRGWRRRVSGRETKHRKLREEEVNRFVSPAQTSKYQ